MGAKGMVFRAWAYEWMPLSSQWLLQLFSTHVTMIHGKPNFGAEVPRLMHKLYGTLRCLSCPYTISMVQPNPAPQTKARTKAMD